MSMKTQVQVPGIQESQAQLPKACHLSTPNRNVEAEAGGPPGAHSSGAPIYSATDSKQWNRATANGSF